MITIVLQCFLNNGSIKKIVVAVSLVITILLTVIFLWMLRMYRAFSYNGKRKLSKEVVEGVADYVK
ncbi:MAG: SAM-dependent methyltransferase, partial [Christensenellaceae bacterium]|nr:SAM-dependent methyltransferase [Christensenellaceae bacterium]